MTYRVNHIFYTLQGEGFHTGRAAAFVRLAGCNLSCSFCDTSFDTFTPMTAADIVAALAPYPTRFVVITGGEPTLQADDALVDCLHRGGYTVAMESNGTRPAPAGVDWLTVSPKAGGLGRLPATAAATPWQRLPDEVKIVADEHTDPEAELRAYLHFLSLHRPAGAPGALLQEPAHLAVQPCDTGDADRNAAIVSRCVDFVKSHPRWRLSLQTHKLIGIE